MISGTGAELEVDTETAREDQAARQRFSTSARPINRASLRRRFPAPRSCSSASRMSEKMHQDGGQVTNRLARRYKIPGFHDVPP